MAKRTKKSSKSPSVSSNTNDTDISPRALRTLEKALANFGKVPGGASLLDSGPGESPLDRAQTLIYDAWEIPNPAKKISLARQALAICPDCADAYVLLAEYQARTLEASIEQFRLAVEAGQRALGAKTFQEDVGHFWGLLETRPYMRARVALASAHWEFGERSVAIAHAQDLLRLNPNDNQGVRAVLMTWLLLAGHLSDGRQLWKRYENDGSAAWAWSLALMNFIERGDGPDANTSLQEAITNNPHLAPLLLGRTALPAHPPDFIGVGDRDEAIAYAFDNMDLWQQTDGALRWLSRAVPSPH
ncbi:MAG TPA: hypothetical protein VFL63_13685 [Rhodanobacteraceae bacterium]|nr:hypothetical protein [Rhodanobacteraceae bacterium]